jgi:hypothetical protein
VVVDEGQGGADMTKAKAKAKKKRGASIALAAEQLHVKDLKHDPKNTRKHTSTNVGMIGDSIQKVGTGRSIVIDEDNKILAGHGTVDAASERGITGVKVIDVDGTELVAIRRRGLTERQKVDLSIADNRAGDLADYDEAMLRQVADEFSIDLKTYEFPDDIGATDVEVDSDQERRISPEMDERQDYLVIVCNNQMDWRALCDRLGVVASLDSSANQDTQVGKAFGVGRVLTAAEVLGRLGTS